MPDPLKPSSNSASLPASLESSLRATRFRLRLLELAAAVLLMLAMGIAGILAIVIADHVVSGGLSLWVRWTLRWIVIGGEACLLIAMIALPMLRRISNLYAARQMEKADPSFHNDLTAAVQLHAESGPAAATAAAVRRSASRQAARMSNGAPIQKRSVRLAALAAAAAVTALCLYWIFAPKSTAVSLQRAMGLGDPPAPTRTRILSLTPEDETSVLTGDEVLFEAQLRYPKGPAVLQIARDAYTVLDEDSLTMTPVDEPGPGEAYRTAWKAISASEWVKFRLVCGDAETPWRRMRVLPTPAVRRVRVECDWPKYTHLPPQRSEGGRVEGPVGTQATVTAEVNLPVRQATLEFESDGRTLVMEPDASGKILTTTFRVNKPGRYVIRYSLRDIDAQAKSIPHDVVVTPDRPPTVQLRQPAGETTLAENESLSVQGEVTDDFGVGQVELVSIAADGQTKTHSLLNVKAPGVSSRQLRSSIPAGSLGRAGDTITCVVLARDFNPSVRGGQAARSQPFTMKIAPARTTAEQQEAAGGQGQPHEAAAQEAQPHEAGDVPMGQAEGDEPQPGATGAEKESQNAQAEADTQTPTETEDPQPGDQETPAEPEEETQPQFGESEPEPEETQPQPEEAKKLEQLCKAMEGQEQEQGEGQEGEGGGEGGGEGELPKPSGEGKGMEGEGSSPGQNPSQGKGPAKGQGEDGAGTSEKNISPGESDDSSDGQGTGESPSQANSNNAPQPNNGKSGKSNNSNNHNRPTPPSRASVNESRPNTAAQQSSPQQPTAANPTEASNPPSQQNPSDASDQPQQQQPEAEENNKNQPLTPPSDTSEKQSQPPSPASKNNTSPPVSPDSSKNQPAEKQQPEEKQQPTEQQPEEKQQAEKRQPTEKQPAEKRQPTEQQQAEKQQAEKQQSTEKQPAEKQQPAEQQQAEKQQAEKQQPTEKQPAEKRQPTEQQQAEKQQAEKQQPTEKQPAEKRQPTEQQQAKKQQAEKQQSTEKQAAEKQQAEKQQAEQQQAEKQQAEKQPQDSAGDQTQAGQQGIGANSAAGLQAGQGLQEGQGQQPGQGQQGSQQQAGQAGESSQARQGAQSVHDQGGQGAGSQKREGELDEVDDDALMPGTAQPLKSVGEALDKARRQIKAGKIDPKLLTEMNMTATQFQDFVEKYTDEYNKALQKRQNDKETVKAKSSLDDDVKKGEANKAGNVSGAAALDKQRSSSDRQTPPAAVSPEYQKQLEAYLRAVSEGEEK